MNENIAYIIMGVIILLIAFLIIRFIAQLIFIRECPKCGKTVSLAKTKICAKCGYDFNETRDPKFHAAVTILVLAILGIGAYDVYTFISQTNQYVAENPYVNVTSIAKKDEISTEATTESPVEQTTEAPTEVPVEVPADGTPEVPVDGTPETLVDGTPAE